MSSGAPIYKCFSESTEKYNVTEMIRATPGHFCAMGSIKAGMPIVVAVVARPAIVAAAVFVPALTQYLEMVPRSPILRYITANKHIFNI